MLSQEAQEPGRSIQRTDDTPGCVPGPRLGSQDEINQLLGDLALLQLPQPLGFALETPASISLGITKETHDQCIHSLLGHDQSEVPKHSWAVTTQSMFAWSTKSPGILRGIPSLGTSHRMAAEPTSARMMAMPSPASNGAPYMRSVSGCWLVCP